MQSKSPRTDRHESGNHESGNHESGNHESGNHESGNSQNGESRDSPAKSRAAPARLQCCAITLFPEFFDSFTDTSLMHKAARDRLFELSTINPRDFSSPPHFHVDDIPYGGGPGMVMRPEPVIGAIEHAKAGLPESVVIATTASGTRFHQGLARQLATKDQLIFICGRYEGIDQRVLDNFVDLQISIGDYVLMGGELPAMVMMEAILRLRTGVLGNPESLLDESHSRLGYLEAPQYTRPENFRGLAVPPVLVNGNHREIAKWRKEQSEQLMKRRALVSGDCLDQRLSKENLK